MLIEPDVTRVPLAIQRSHDKEMFSITRENGLTTVRINYSSLSIIQECARKSYYSFHEMLRSKTEGPATLFGGAIHKALEVYYKEPAGTRTIPRNFNEHSEVMAYGTPPPEPEHVLYRAIQAFLEHAEPLRALPSTDKRSLDAGIYVLQNYFKTYIEKEQDPWEIYRDAEGPVVERYCDLEIYNDGKVKIILFGSIDCILRNVQTGIVLPTDHKTSSVVGNDFYNRLKPNHQYSGYFLLAKEKLGIKGDGFLVNCLQVKARPLTARGAPPQFPRQVTTRTENDLIEFKEAVIDAVFNYLRWEQTGIWPMGSVNVCTFWGGCPYLEVCGAPPSIRPNLIESKFISIKERDSAQSCGNKN